MKALRYCSLIFVFIMFVSCFTGCITVQIVPSEAPQSASPEQSEPPEQSAEPTEAPTDTLLLPDNDVKASFLYDLNGDGAKETISVGLGKENEIGSDIILSVSDSGAFNEALIDSGYYESANLTAAPGGAPCLVVSISYEDDYRSTFACSFDGLKPAVNGKVEGTVSEVSGFYVTTDGWVDALGTWGCTRIYGITDSFAFEPLNDYQIDMTYRDPLITKIKLPAEIWENDKYIAATLGAGTAVYPTATDGETYMLFKLDDGREGKISFTRQDYECYIGGVNENDCFETVPYAG